MALDEEDDITHSDLVGIPAAEVPEFEEEQAPTPAPTPLVRPPVYETPAPTPLTPPAGYGESGAPTPFVERSHVPIDDKTASDYMAELKTMYPGQNDLRAEHLIRELDLYATTEPEREKYQDRQYLRDVFTDDDALKQFSDTDEMRQRERFSVNPNLERYRAANWMQIEHETGKTIHDDLEYETERNNIARERDGKPVTSDMDFYNSRRKEYELDKQLELAQTELIGKGVLKTISDQAQGKPTEITSVIDEVISKYPDAFTTDAQKDTAAVILRDSTAIIRETTERLRPVLGEAFPIIEKMANHTATDEEKMSLYRLIGGMLPTKHDNPDVRAAKRKDIGTLIGLSEMALNSQGEKLDRNALMTELENAKKALFEGFGWIAQGSITQQEDKLSVGLKTIEDGSAVIGPYGLDFRLPGSPRPGGRDLTPDEQAKYTEQLEAGLNVLEAQRIMNDALVKKLDPIEYLAREGTFWGTAERMSLDAIQSLPFMGTAVVAGVLGSLAGGPIGAYAASGAVMTVMTAEQEFQDLTINNPELDRDTRKTYANWSAIAQLPFNYLEVELFAGAFPTIGAIFRDLKAGAIGTAIARATGRQLAEFTAETIQNGISDLTQIIAQQANSNLPTKMHQVWNQAVEQGPRTFFAVLPFTLIGTGMASLRDYGVYAKELATADALGAAGFSKAQIDMILAGRTIEERSEILQREMPLRDPEVVKAAGAKLAQELESANQAAGAMQQIAGMPTMERSKKADGTIEYTVKDVAGNVVTTTTSLEQAKLSFGEQAEIAMQEMLVRAEEQQVSEEAAATAAEAEARISQLPPEEQAQARMSPSAVLEFEGREQPPTAEQQAKVDALNATLAESGFPEAVRAVSPLPDQGTPAGRLAASFIQGFQQYTGKSVQFIASESGESLPYRGVVNPADPNTIFLDAAGDRGILALLGHEWSHTLKATNPKLYAAFIDAARPLVAEWEAEKARIAERAGGKYKPEQLTDEIVANIIGDAFAHPEFLKRLAQRNPGAFENLVNFIKEWFAKFIDAATHSTWGTEALISDIKAMHDLIIDTMEQARAGPEVAVEPEEGVAFALREFAVGRYSMEIERGVREVQGIVDYTGEDQKKVENFVSEFLKSEGAANIPKRGPRRAAILQEIIRQVAQDIRDHRIYFPEKLEPKTESTTGVTTVWAPANFTGIQAVYDPTGGKDGKTFVKAYAKWQAQNYTFDKPPPGVSKEAWADQLATKMVDQFLERLAKGDTNAETIKTHIGWYRNFIGKVRKDYGGFSDMFADFLGAFSPITNVDENWANAIVFLDQVTNGKYDSLFKEMDEWVRGGKSIDQWRKANKPIPLKEDDLTKFGTNTNNGLLAVLDMWRLVQKGDAPKARNFTKNLIGLSIEATIDRWAARLLQRVAGLPRLSVSPKIGGLHITPTEVGGAFGFGQDVFRIAVEKLKATGDPLFEGLLPSDLQAMNWFVEKEIWSENNWTNDAGEGGSFEERIAEQNANRFVIGLSMARPSKKLPTTTENVAFGQRVKDDLIATMKKVGQFLAVRTKDSAGMYKGDAERSLDAELLTGPNIEPFDIVRIAAKHAAAEKQKSTFVARVIKDHEPTNPNARPGTEIYFDHQVDPSELQPVMEFLESRDINGFTLIVDHRAKPNPLKGAGGPDQVWGIRFMYVPEYDNKGDKWRERAEEIDDILDAAVDELRAIPGVAHVVQLQYDALVLKAKDDYDQRGIRETSLGATVADAWRRRFLSAATASPTAEHEGVSGRPEVTVPIPSGGEGPGIRGPPGGGAGEGVAFSLREAKKAQARAEAPLEREASIQAIFERIHAAPAKRAELVARAAQAFAEVRARHLQQLAEFEAPEVPDEEAGLKELEAQETLALEDVDAEEQAALDQNTLNVADRYGDRILAEQDLAKRRALERQQKLVEAAQRKGIEARFNERRQGVAREFTIRRQALHAEVAEATAAATAEGAAELRRLKQVQTYAELNAILKSLPPDIRGRLPPTPNLGDMSDEQLTDFLVKRITQISNVMEFVQKRSFQEAITDLLARFKPKKSAAGIVKSRIGADAQDVVTRASAYLKMDGATVQAESDGIEAKLSQGGLTAEEESALIIRQNELETFGAMKEMSAAELEVALNELKATIQTGRASWGVSEEERLADMQNKAAEGVRMLPAATGPGVSAKNRQKVRNLLANLARNHTSFIQVIGRVFPGVSFAPEWESTAIRLDSADTDYVRETQQRLVDDIGRALGTKSTVRIGDALGKMDNPNIPVLGGMASKREAIHYLFAWGQPAVQERMRNQGWTDEHIRVIQEATADPVSQALMAFYRREYEAIYQRANVVYRKLYGMNLPRIEGTYAPMRYHGAGGPAELTPTGAVVSSGVTPSAIKGRVAHNALLRQVDSLQVFSEHLYQMSHWIHFAEFIRETRGVLNNPQVKMALEQSIGAQGVIDLQNQLDAVTRNGVMRSSEVKGINEIITNLSKGVAVGAMAFNMHSAVVQGDSALRWMTAIPMQRWGKALLLHRWFANISKAWHSDTVQRRVMQGTNPAVRAAMEQNNLTPSALLKLVDIGFWHLNYFDGAMTALSSAIVYTDAIDQGLNEEQALQKMDEAVSRFSQPIMVTSKTQALVNANPALRSILMFMADPMLKTSLSMEGIMNVSRGFKAKDMSLVEKGVRSLVAVEIWSLVSQFILNAWSHGTGDDEEEEGIWAFRHFWRAAILAPIQGFFVMGDIAEGLVRAAFGEKVWTKEVPVFRFSREVHKTITHWQDLLDPSDPDFYKELSNLTKLAGMSAAAAGASSGWAAGVSAVQRGVTAVQAAQEKLEE